MKREGEGEREREREKRERNWRENETLPFKLCPSQRIAM
jgi:hypothetical protein